MTATAQAVGERLGLKPLVYTLKDLAREKNIPLEEINALKAKEFPKFDYELDGRNIEAAVDGTILGSDIAVWLVDADLKVWLHASTRTRAKRMAARENIMLKEALDKVRGRDKSYAEHYKRLYGLSWKKFNEAADLVINTERIELDKVADVIADAAKRLPFGKNKAASRKTKKIHDIIFKK